MQKRQRPLARPLRVASAWRSATAAHRAHADLEQIAQAQLAIAILIQHRAEQSATQAALLLLHLAFLAQYLAQHVRRRLLLAAG